MAQTPRRPTWKLRTSAAYYACHSACLHRTEPALYPPIPAAYIRKFFSPVVEDMGLLTSLSTLSLASNQHPALLHPAFFGTERRRHRTCSPGPPAYAWRRSHLDTASCAGRRCGGLSCRPAFEANPPARWRATCQDDVRLSRCGGGDGALFLHENDEPARRGHERRIATPGSPDRNMRVLHSNASPMGAREEPRCAQAGTPPLRSTGGRCC
jgi:hypothetical protein